MYGMNCLPASGASLGGAGCPMCPTKRDVLEAVRLNPLFTVLFCLWILGLALIIGINQFFLKTVIIAINLKPFVIGWASIPFALGLLSLRFKEPNTETTPFRSRLILCIVFIIVGCIVFEYTVLPPSQERDLALDCIHEAGHAVVAEYISPGSVKSAVLIEPWKRRWLQLFNDDTVAYVSRKPPDGETLTNAQNEICIALGGLVAEEILMPGETYGGASGDLHKVERIVVEIVNHGMCNTQGRNWNLLTENERATIARDIITPQYERAKKIILKKQEAVMALSQELQEHKAMTGEQVREVLAGYFGKSKNDLH